MAPLPENKIAAGSPAVAPKRTEPIRIVSPARPPRRWKALTAGLLLIVIAAIGAWTLRQRQVSARKADVAAATRTARVVRGVLERTIRVTATTTTNNFASIAAPLMQGPDAERELILLHIAEPGVAVKKGQVVAELDGQSLADHIEDAKGQVVQAQMEYRRLEAQQAVTLESFKQRARAAKAELEKARLNARAAEVRNTIDRELLRLAVEEAQLQHEEYLRQIELVDERQASERALSEFRVAYQVRHVTRHQADLGRFAMRAPIDGQLVLKTINRNGQTAQVRSGDQLAPAQPFMRVVDLASIALEGSISQTDSEIVRRGQRAKIHFDAYPDLVMDGRIEMVGQLAMSGRRTNYFVRRIPVRISLEGSDPRVIPDLTASADVVVSDEDDSLLIPRDAVQESGGKSMVLVKQGETLLPREVEIGALGATQVAVVSGLQEGEEIAVQREANTIK